jgi:ABC-2 type transport system permease protein
MYLKYLTQTTGTIAGFDFVDLFIMTSLGQIWFSSLMIFTFPMSEATVNNIIRGNFDFYLIRPVNSFYTSLMQNIKAPYLLLVLQYVIFFIYGLSLKKGSIDMLSLLISLFALILGMLIFFFFQVAFTTLAFYFKDVKDSIWKIVNMQDLDNYPFKIYPIAIRIIGFSIIPVFYISNVPANILLGKESLLIVLSSMVMAIVWGFIAIKLWNRGTRHYDSASS